MEKISGSGGVGSRVMFRVLGSRAMPTEGESVGEGFWGREVGMERGVGVSERVGIRLGVGVGEGTMQS